MSDQSDRKRDEFKPDPAVSPFTRRFNIDRLRRQWESLGGMSEEHSHTLAHDLYEIDESYERMFYALREGIVARAEAGDIEGSFEALIMYQVWLQHLTWHAETFIETVEEWIESQPDDEETDGEA